MNEYLLFVVVDWFRKVFVFCNYLKSYYIRLNKRMFDIIMKLYLNLNRGFFIFILESIYFKG